jgi:hypothetical protein
MDVFSLTELVTAIRQTAHKETAEIKGVFSRYGIPDYESVFGNVPVSDKPATGIMRQVIMDNLVLLCSSIINSINNYYY